jgi:gliding motility-associated lipoprotein GldH
MYYSIIGNTYFCIMTFKHLVFFTHQSIARYSIIFLFVTIICSCTKTDVFEKNTNIPNLQWKSNFAAQGTFAITDTNSLYNTYIVLRHVDAYTYNNIWLNIGLQTPGDTMRYQKVNMQLGNDINGWEGTGMNDIWEIRKLFLTLKKPGTYQFSITQIMRDDPLPNIMSAGLRVQKETQR